MAKQPLIQPKKLKGFRDFTPDACSVRERIISTVRKHAQNAGFAEISTPVIEYQETLLGTGNQETDKEVYRFMDHGDRQVALRFDLTVPFARYVAEHQGTMFLPFKKFQVGEVFRGEKPQKGRLRQFCQADIDVIGVDSLNADVEVIACIMNTLQELIPAPFTMSVGERVILSALIRSFFPKLEKSDSTAVLIAIDKLAKIGFDKVIGLIADIPGCDEASARELLTLIQPGDGDTALAPLRERFANLPEILAQLDRYERSLKLLRAQFPIGNAKIRGDLSLARGLGYYTGVIFEAVIDSLPGLGSVSGGGRYNELVNRFSNRELPGVGGSVGVDRLLEALSQLAPPEDPSMGTVFIAIATEDALDFGFDVLKQLRAAGVSADIAMKLGKLGQQFKYADRHKFKFVATLGTDEVASRTISVKELATGQETKSLPIADLIGFVTK